MTGECEEVDDDEDDGEEVGMETPAKMQPKAFSLASTCATPPPLKKGSSPSSNPITTDFESVAACTESSGGRGPINQ